MKNSILFLLSLAFLACGKQENKIDNTSINTEEDNKIVVSKQQFETENMELGSFVEHEFTSYVKANGIIDVPPENRAIVNTFIGGYVTKVPLLIGDFVKKGQFVASLTNTDFIEIQQKYLEISAQLNYLKTEFERQKTLYNENISSKKSYLKAESNYKSNLAVYNGLKKKLEMMQINPTEVEKGNLTPSINLYAPIDGYVTEVWVSNGSFVSSETKLMEIVNTKHIHLELNVFEKDILKLKKEQKIVFKVPESSENYFDASVHLLGTSIKDDKTVKVHGHIENESQNFMTGMFVEAKIIYQNNKEIALPNSAIISEENQSFILIVKEQNNEQTTFEKKIVSIGNRDENYSQIINFKDFNGKKILLKGAFML